MANNITWGKMKHIFKECGDDTPVTLEFLNSFPDFKNAYNEGLVDKFNEWKDKSIDSIRDEIYKENDAIYNEVAMTGMITDLKDMQRYVTRLSNMLKNQEMSLSDAPFHGWNGDSLQNMLKINSDLSRLNNQMDYIIKRGLNNDGKKC